MKGFKELRRRWHTAAAEAPSARSWAWSPSRLISTPSPFVSGYGSVIDLAGHGALMRMANTVNSNIRPEAQRDDWVAVSKCFDLAFEQVESEFDESARRWVAIVWQDALAEQIVEGLRDARGASGGASDEQLRLM